MVPASERRRRLRSQHVFTPAPAAARALFFGPAHRLSRVASTRFYCFGSVHRFRVPRVHASAPRLQSSSRLCTVQSLFFAIYTARPHMILLPRHRMLLHNWARRTVSTRYPRHTGHAIPAYSATLPSVNPFCCLAPLYDGTTRNSFGTQRHFEFANTANLLLGLCSGTTFLCPIFERNMDSTHAQIIRHSMARGATCLISHDALLGTISDSSAQLSLSTVGFGTLSPRTLFCPQYQ